MGYTDGFSKFRISKQQLKQLEGQPWGAMGTDESGNFVKLKPDKVEDDSCPWGVKMTDRETGKVVELKPRRVTDPEILMRIQEQARARQQEKEEGQVFSGDLMELK